MRFPSFYGNEGLKQRLSRTGQRLSHCYILEGPAGSGRKTLANILSAAMECESGGERPCGVCAACRKVERREHPDVITVDSDRATVPISKIREMQADAYIRPNEGRRKIYLIPRAQDMQAPAQNALLKLLEEPPGYCAFLLITDSADKLLSTVRSRSVTLTLSPLSRQTLRTALEERAPDRSPEELARAMDLSDGYLGAALSALDAADSELEQKAGAVATALASHDELTMLQALLPLEKLKKQDLLELLSSLERTLVLAMDPGSIRTETCKTLAGSCTTAQLFRAAEAVAEATTMLQANVSIGHTVGSLMARLHP